MNQFYGASSVFHIRPGTSIKELYEWAKSHNAENASLRFAEYSGKLELIGTATINEWKDAINLYKERY